MKSLCISIGALFLTFLFIGCVSSSDEGNEGTGIKGKLVLENGDPANGAQLTLIPLRIDSGALKYSSRPGPEDFSNLPKESSDEKGEFWFDGLRPGLYNIAGYGVKLNADGDTVENLGVLIKNITVEDSNITDVGENTLKSLGSAVVTLVQSDNERVDSIKCTVEELALSVLSDTSGNCEFPDLPPGEFTVIFENESYDIDPAQGIKVSEGDTTKKETKVDTSGNSKDSTVLNVDSVHLYVGISGESGSVSPENVKIEKGDTVEIEAKADSNSKFIKWTTSGSAEILDSTAEKTQVTLTKSDSVTAHFERIFKLSYDISGRGSVVANRDTLTGKGELKLINNTELSLSVIHDSNSQFSNWKLGDSTYGDSSLEIKIISDTMLTAAFDSITSDTLPQDTIPQDSAVDSVTVLIIQSPGGTTHAKKDSSKNDSTKGTIRAPDSFFDVFSTTDSCWYFKGWKTLSGKIDIRDPKSPATQIKAQEDSSSFTAEFGRMGRYTLNPKGEGIVAESRACAHPDSSYIIEATPKDNHKFSHWVLVSGTAVIEDSSMAKTTIKSSERDTSVIEGVFVPITHTLTISHDPAEGDLNKPQNTVTTVEQGKPVELDMSSKSGFRFSHWALTGDSAQIENSNAGKTTITLFSDIRATAHFDARYTLTASSNGNGHASPGSANVFEGDTLEVTAVPGSDYSFQDWDIVSGTVTILDRTSITTKVVLESNAEIRAIFVRKKDTLNLKAQNIPQDSAGLNPSTPTPFNKGDTIAIHAVADTGRYIFSHWTVESGSVTFIDSTKNSTQVVPDGNSTLIAVYQLKYYQLIMLPAVGGFGTPAGTTQVFLTQPRIQLGAKPTNDSAFVKWTIEKGNGTLADSTNPSSFLTVQSDISVRPNFTVAMDTLITMTLLRNYFPSPDTSIVPRGTVITIKANPRNQNFPVNWTTTTGQVTFTEGTSPTDDEAKVIIVPSQKGGPASRATLVPHIIN